MSSVNRKKKIKDTEKVGPIHIYSYQLLNERFETLYPKFKPLEKNIKESMHLIRYEMHRTN